MQFKINMVVLFIATISVLSCKRGDQSHLPDTTPQSAMAEILRLHNLQRDYHFQKNVKDFVDLLSDDHIGVNKGIISHLTKEENTTRFNNYFSSVEFEKWDDIDPPIIKFSEDSTLAYTIVHKIVELTSIDSTDVDVKESVEYAWIAIYRRIGDVWKIECAVSTNKG